VSAALVVWALAELALGVEVRSPAFGGQASQEIGGANVAVTALLASLAGWGLLALLERFTARARGVWTLVAALVLLASFATPLSGEGIPTATRAALLAMHAAVAAVLVPVMRRTSAR
jgi:hypothetical protein